MKRKLLEISTIWFHELKLIFRDPAIILLFLVVPFGYPLIYSFIYNTETVHNVKAVIVDDSGSSLSRDFKRKIDATPDIKVIGYASDMHEAKDILHRKEAYAIFYIPRDFSTKINTLRQTRVDIYADMSSLLFYKAALLAATEVSLDMGADIRVKDMSATSTTDKQDQVIRQTVKNHWTPLYNVTNGFASFLVPAILILIIQQTLVLGISTITGTAVDKRRLGDKNYLPHYANPFIVTLSKGLCYLLIYMFVSVWVLRIIPYIFRFPQIGDPVAIALFLLPFTMAATFFAMTLSYFCSQREYPMLLFVFTSVLFIFLTGISWPWNSIPAPLQAIAYIFPSTPGVHGFIRLNTMGGTLSEVKTEYIVLWIHTIVYFITAMLMYKWWLKRYYPINIK